MVLKKIMGPNTISVFSLLMCMTISNSQGIMLVYDITQEKTFDNISKWLRNIEEVCQYFIKVFVCNNA